MKLRIPPLPRLLRSSAANSPIPLVHKASRLSVGAALAISLAIVFATAIASAQTVTYTGSIAVNFGSANVCPSGKTAPAPCSHTLTLTYNVTASGILGTPQALTTGASNLDYKLAGGTTCAGSVTKGNTCKVNVTFAPVAPGARNGAVEILDSTGNVLATTYIYGAGVGPRITFSPPAQSPIYANPNAFAIDGGGNIFISSGISEDGDDLTVEELLAVNGSVPENPDVKVLKTSFSGGEFPSVPSLALDGAGNLFFIVNEYGAGGYVEKLLASDGYGSSTILAGSSTFMDPVGVAVDGSGNVFVAAYIVGTPATLYELFANSGYQTAKPLASGTPVVAQSLALDASGNLFVSNVYPESGNPGTGNVLEFTPNDGYTKGRVINAVYGNASSGYYSPVTFALDAAGNLYGAFPSNTNSVFEFLAVDGVLPSNPASLIFPTVTCCQAGPMGFDSHGNFYLVDGGFYENLLATPAPLSFAKTIVGNTSSDSPKSVEIQNQGNATLDLTALSSDSSSWELVKGSGTPEDCTASTSLASSALCNLSISFKPTEAGQLTGAVAVADNSLNASSATQSILLNGTADTPTAPQITSLNSTYGASYSWVILTGENFGTTKGSSTVTFNGIAAPTYRWTDTLIWATVPPNATTGGLLVNVDGQHNDPIVFTVLPMPMLTGMSPTSGPVGTVVTITGKNLVDYGDNLQITFTGAIAGMEPPFVSSSSTSIQVQIPPFRANTGHFHIVTNDTGMNTSTFTVTQ